MDTSTSNNATTNESINPTTLENFTTQTSILNATVGNTPLVELQRLGKADLGDCKNKIRFLAKLEGNNPAGSVKDRAALHMVLQAEKRGDIKVGDTLIEATSGNTGIALAMVAAMRGYKMILIMPANSTQERKDAMRAYGATLIDFDGGIEESRDLALQMQAEGKGIVLDQFSNPDNKQAHYLTTAPEIWQQTQGKITHFISSMGTTGTISGIGKYLKEQNPDIEVIGLQPADGASIAGIRKWGEGYMPAIFDGSVVDRVLEVSQSEAEIYMRKLAKEEGIFAGVSSGGNCWGAVQVAKEISQQIKDEDPNAVIVFIVCDRGDRYLSTGLYGVED